MAYNNNKIISFVVFFILIRTLFSAPLGFEAFVEHARSLPTLFKASSSSRSFGESSFHPRITSETPSTERSWRSKLPSFPISKEAFTSAWSESKFNPSNWKSPFSSGVSSSPKAAFWDRLSGLKSSTLFSPSTWEFPSSKTTWSDSKFNPSNWKSPFSSEVLSSPMATFRDRLSGLKSSTLFSPSTWEFPSSKTKSLSELKEIGERLNGNPDHFKEEGIFRKEKPLKSKITTLSGLPENLKDDPIALAQIYKRKFKSIITPASEMQLSILGDGTNAKAVNAFLDSLPSHQREAVGMAADMANTVSAHSAHNKMKESNMALMLSNAFVPKDIKNQADVMKSSNAFQNAFAVIMNDARPAKPMTPISSAPPTLPALDLGQPLGIDPHSFVLK